MENKSALLQRLKELENQTDTYKFIVEKLFDNPLLLSEKEKNEFIHQNKENISEYQKLIKEMGDIEWKLMTTKQQKDYIEKYSEE